MKAAASIITFNPDIKRLSDCIDAAIIQVSQLVIIDNNSKNIDEIENIIKKYSDEEILFISNNKNMGLGYALNQILSVTSKEGYEWVLTLDQDSIVPQGYVDECMNYISKYSGEHNIGIICPRMKDINSNSGKRVNSNNYSEKILICITSGSFTNISAAVTCGGFDEFLFIDGVDHDLCIKLNNNGYSVIRLNNFSLLHEIGKNTSHRLFGFNYYSSNHNSFRLFYIYRNHIIILKKYKQFRKVNKDMDKWLHEYTINLFIKKTIKIILAEDHKCAKLKSIFKGIFAGIAYKSSMR